MALCRRSSPMSLATVVTDIVAAPLFRTEPDGRRVFAPSAVSGKRFLIPDAETEARLRGRMARLMGISLVISLTLIGGAVALFGSASTWTAAVWIGLAAAFGLHIVVNAKLGKGLAKGLQETATAQPVGLARSMVDQAVAWPLWLVLLELVMGPMVLWGAIMGFQSASTTYDLTLSLIAFPLSLLMIAYGLVGLLGRTRLKLTQLR